MKVCRNGDQFMRNFTKIYENLCQVDCINDEYLVINKYKNDKKYSDPKFWNLEFYWDESKPIIINEEKPVMEFADYICYIGGLFGMWFGVSANQLIRNFIGNH
jgi:hypothetical protein